MPARGAVRLANGDDAYRLIVSDLVSLIVHAQASLRLIESAIDRQSSSVGEAMSADVIVFDDVTPRCFKAGAALKACATCARLAAMHSNKRITRSSVRFPWAVRRVVYCPACPSGTEYPFPRR